jgi:hypothetical protein
LPAKSENPPGELDDPEDDQDPAHRVEVGEDEPLLVDEDVRAVERADAVDDVQRPGN